MEDKYINYTQEELDDEYDSLYNRYEEIMPSDCSLEYYEMYSSLLSADTREGIGILKVYIENYEEE